MPDTKSKVTIKCPATNISNHRASYRKGRVNFERNFDETEKLNFPTDSIIPKVNQTKLFAKGKQAALCNKVRCWGSGGLYVILSLFLSAARILLFCLFFS